MEVFDQISQQVQDALEAAPLLLQRVIIGLLVFAAVARLRASCMWWCGGARHTGGITVEHACRAHCDCGHYSVALTALSTMGVDIAALIAALGLTSLNRPGIEDDQNAITGVLLLIQRPFKVRRDQGERCDGHCRRCCHPRRTSNLDGCTCWSPTGTFTMKSSPTGRITPRAA
jgi:hypothetical protein